MEFDLGFIHSKTLIEKFEAFTLDVKIVVRNISYDSGIRAKPEIEARVTALAAAQGVSVKEYVQSFLESLASLKEESSYDSMAPE